MTEDRRILAAMLKAAFGAADVRGKASKRALARMFPAKLPPITTHIETKPPPRARPTSKPAKPRRAKQLPLL